MRFTEDDFAVLKLMDHFQMQLVLEYALYDSFIRGFIKTHMNPF